MGRSVVYLSLGIAATLWMSNGTAAETTTSSRMIKGVISKVVDGDTLWVTPKGNAGNNIDAETAAAKPKVMKIRMLGMDAPEAHLPVSGGVVSQAPWGDKSTNELAELIPVGTAVSVEDQGLDKYKRTLGKVWVKKSDINLEMVKIGWAIPYIICEGSRCNENYLEDQHTQQYLEACDYARGKKLGLWNPKEPLKEMPFEFRLRMQGRDPEKFVGSFQTKEYYRPEDYQEVDVCDRVFFMKESDATHAGFTEARKKPRN